MVVATVTMPVATVTIPVATVIVVLVDVLGRHEGISSNSSVWTPTLPNTTYICESANISQ